nr:FtsX-like permease family protein [Lactobacillus kitasatonis]
MSPFSVTYRNRVYHDQGKLQTALNKNRADSERVEVLANVFPGFLFAVAAFVSWTTMMRFVEEERTNIGTLKALGYSNGAIAIKFLLYSTSAAILGVILGISFGYTFLPDLIIKAYLASSTLGTGYEINFAWGPLLISLLVALISTTVISIFTLHQTLREQPSALLLPNHQKMVQESCWNIGVGYGTT